MTRFSRQARRISPPFSQVVARDVLNKAVRGVLTAKVRQSHPNQVVKVEEKQDGARGYGYKVGAAEFTKEADDEEFARDASVRGLDDFDVVASVGTGLASSASSRRFRCMLMLFPQVESVALGVHWLQCVDGHTSHDADNSENVGRQVREEDGEKGVQGAEDVGIVTKIEIQVRDADDMRYADEYEQEVDE